MVIICFDCLETRHKILHPPLQVKFHILIANTIYLSICTFKIVFQKIIWLLKCPSEKLI